MRYEVNVSRLENPSGNIRGFVNVVFNNCFKISNIAVIEGKEENIFVSMPRYATSRGDEDYKDVCNPITREFREELYNTILDTFETLEPGKHTKVNIGKDEKKEPLDFNVKVTPFEKEGSNIRGLARVYLADAFVINNVSLLEGRNGLFVAMPSYRVKQAGENGKSEFQDICYPVTKAFREKLYSAVTEAYELAKKEKEKQPISERPAEKGKAADKDGQWMEAPASDAAKRKGQSALYKITQVTGMKKKLAAIKDKVDRAIDRVDNLEKAVEECHGQQRETGQEVSALENCAVAEPEGKYGAEMFEQYQREHGAEQILEAAGQTVTQEIQKSR